MRQCVLHLQPGGVGDPQKEASGEDPRFPNILTYIPAIDLVLLVVLSVAQLALPHMCPQGDFLLATCS